MGKTHKTDPYWVKLHREGIENHDHRNGECDYDPDMDAHKDTRHWSERWTSCDKRQSRYSYLDNDWFPRPAIVRSYAKTNTRKQRQKVRADLGKGRYERIDNHGTARSQASWDAF